LTPYSGKTLNNWFEIQLLVSELFKLQYAFGPSPTHQQSTLTYGLSKGALHKHEKNEKTIVPLALSTQKNQVYEFLMDVIWGGVSDASSFRLLGLT